MSIFKFGLIIRKRREELGYSQEDIADGICSVTTLSRIENGERLPTKNHIEMLLQRLGYSDTLIDCYVDDDDYYIHELKFRIRQAYISKEYDRAKMLLNEYQQKNIKNNSINLQFLMLYQVLLIDEDYSNEEKLKKLENAIRLTYPKYMKNNIPHVLSYEEIIILNNIANHYAFCGDRMSAIDILYALRQYYEKHIVNTEEALRTQPLILYNLSKWLGLEGRYDECIEICLSGIRIAKSTGRCTMLSKTLFNFAWALVKRNRAEDTESAKNAAQQAYNMACIMEQHSSAELYRSFYEEHFSDN